MCSLRRGARHLVVCCGLIAPLVPAQEGFRVGETLATPAAKPAPAGVADLEWEALLPPGWNPRQALEGIDLAALSDNDPKANALLERLRRELDQAPVVKSLDGRRVRLAGFVVTLERDERGVKEFLLVPYFGACIHTPPPPANQIVHVRAKTPYPAEKAIFPVYVTGTLSTVAAMTSEGAAGYRIANAEVEEYPWRRQRR
ncbi:MAG: DUF3299 domain-containing protein [Rhodocyclaceae bacterium]|nr:DUF3299 domain-containing protein [Rhodocyclaceae bacterium]